MHIRDMHRLLSYKGDSLHHTLGEELTRFRIPLQSIRCRPSAIGAKSERGELALRVKTSVERSQGLKSPEELEEEDRAAKSAVGLRSLSARCKLTATQKLQELIRRGTPRDLAAAQELMKQLAGAEPDKAVDYASQTLAELDKVQSKAILLNDMLNNAKEGEKIGLDGDVYDQVAAACRGARPKIQRWIEEDDGEREGMMGQSRHWECVELTECARPVVVVQ